MPSLAESSMSAWLSLDKMELPLTSDHPHIKRSTGSCCGRDSYGGQCAGVQIAATRKLGRFFCRHPGFRADRTYRWATNDRSPCPPERHRVWPWRRSEHVLHAAAMDRRETRRAAWSLCPGHPQARCLYEGRRTSPTCDASCDRQPPLTRLATCACRLTGLSKAGPCLSATMSDTCSLDATPD